eukprot:2765185-Amphidinium_carterae.1
MLCLVDWTEERTSKVYGTDEPCRFRQQAEGSASHLVFDCPAFDLQRKNAEIQPWEEGNPGSGKHPAEPSHKRCGCGVAGDTTKVSHPLPGDYRDVGSRCIEQSYMPS